MFVIDCLGPKPELRIAEFLGRQLPLPKQAVQAQQLKRASWQRVRRFTLCVPERVEPPASGTRPAIPDA